MHRLRLIPSVVAVAVALVAGAGNQALAGGSGYLVDTTSDPSLTTCDQVIDNDCSLRGAISRANAPSTPQDIISFDATDFPAGAPATIAIGSMVGSLTGGSDTINATGRGVIIDGVNVEPAYAAFSCVRLDSDSNQVLGLQLTDCQFGIEVTSVADSNQLSSNVIYDNSVGIGLAGNSNVAYLNKVGTDATGSVIHPDGGNNTGISVTGDGNQIGAGEANVISGNLTDGVNIQPSADLTAVEGNFIGTDVEGESDLGNGVTGVKVFGTNTTIGATTAAARNVISGNLIGISISGAAATGNAVLNNYIGTNAVGTGDLGNSADGINISNAPGNCIGGTLVIVATVCTTGTASRNVISGNGGPGVTVFGATATSNDIFGNDIGLQVDRSTPLGNGNNGIAISGGASGTRIGYINTGEGNRIAHNVGDGIFVESGTGTQILSNEIFNNSGLGIDLGPNGVTPNDLDDPDGGANNLQNYPVLTMASSIGAGTTILGSLNSTPNTEFVIEFYASSSCDPSGFGEGETPIGYGGGVTDGGGDLPINTTLPTSVPGLRYITATVGTDAQPASNSEFSNCVQVPPIVVNSAADPGDGACTLANCTLREAITAANAAPELSVIHFAIPGPPTITPAPSALPEITAPVWINARTQPGYAGNPVIEITGTGIVLTSSGLRLSADDSIIEGLNVNRFGQYGITVNGHSNIVRNNFIGTNLSGTAAFGNGLGGIALATVSSTKFNTIGGTTAADRNVISGNSGNGVLLTAFSADNTISGNYIGTDATGAIDLGNGQSGILVQSLNNTIGGLVSGARNVISGNNADAVLLDAGVSGNKVFGNYIGTNAAGTAALGNGLSGVHLLNAGNNLVGSSLAGSGNVISGHSEAGVDINGLGSNIVRGNYIGTDAAGAAGLSPRQDGVRMRAGAAGNFIGGIITGAGNVISGNDSGVSITGFTSDNNTIQGNFIGTNAAGTGVVGNNYGVSIFDASGTLVGGAVAGARNVISGNDLSAVQIQNAGASSNSIKGNYIGTDITGMVGLGNGGYGILVVQGNSTIIGGNTAAETNVIAATGPDGFSSPGYGIFLNSDNNFVDANRIGTAADGASPLGNGADGVYVAGDNNTIGGAPANSNTIAFNGGAGVRLPAGAGIGNMIRYNSMFSNVGLGIDLGAEGVTINDDMDPDVGPNSLQNFASITGVTVTPPNVTINGLLNSIPNSGYLVVIFQSYSCDPSSFGEGTNLLGVVIVNTGQFGVGGFTLNTTTAQVPPGSFITATAQSASGTSEFSLCHTVFSDSDDDDDGYTNTVESGSPFCAGSVNDDAFDDAVVNDGCFLAQVGSFSEAQFKIGTNSKDPCGNDGWPSDLDQQPLSFNELDIFDITSFIAPLRRLDTLPTSPAYSTRWDLAPGPTAPFANFINIIDLTTLLSGAAGSPAYPPMFGGLRAFGRTCPFPP